MNYATSVLRDQIGKRELDFLLQKRNRRARRTNAQAELEAAVKLRQASELIGEKGYRMRTLQTLDSIAAEKSTVVTFLTGLIGSMAEGDEKPLDQILEKVVDISLITI